MDRLTAGQHAATLSALDDLWSQTEVIEIDDPLVRRAADLSRRFAPRGYDAVHCASAEQIADQDLIAVAGDRHLLEAWHQLGLATVDTNPPNG